VELDKKGRSGSRGQLKWQRLRAFEQFAGVEYMVQPLQEAISMGY
jgi:hypothetical protein